MKILHISTYDSGGAGLAALRLHKALLDNGIDSKMLVADKKSDIDTVFVATESTINKYNPPKNPIARFIKVCLRKLGIGLERFEKYKESISKLQQQYPAFYTYPISSYELHKHPLVQEADIIHLHWIENFVDYETFFPNVGKPIVWTFHDLNPLYGGFHHVRKREAYYKYYKDVEDNLCRIKEKAIKQCNNLNIVAISNQMEQLIKGHNLYKDRPITLIHNSIDGTQFTLYDKSIVRDILKIPNDSKICLFVNAYLNDSEKGLDNAILALEQLNQNNIILICVGDGEIPKCRIKTIHFNSVRDTVWLSILYSAADYLLFPSFQEAFAQTPMESLCCGTPVIITPVSGSEDLINGTNGIISKDFTPDCFAESIVKAFSNAYNSDALRYDVLNRFNPQLTADKYISLYNSITSV